MENKSIGLNFSCGENEIQVEIKEQNLKFSEIQNYIRNLFSFNENICKCIFDYLLEVNSNLNNFPTPKIPILEKEKKVSPCCWATIHLLFSYPLKRLIFDCMDSCIRMGRDARSSIKLIHPGSSRKHCDLYRDRHGFVFLKNYSTNGVWVNGIYLEPNQKRLIFDNDIIELVRPCKEYPETLICTIYLNNKNNNHKYHFGPYEIISLLGSGQFANVYKCIHILTKEKYAIKIFHSPRRHLSTFYNEIKILQNVNHPLIVKLIDYLETNEFIALVFEFIDGINLLDYMVALDTPMTETRARYIFVQIIEILWYLDKHGIVHRDLKLENILLVNHNLVVKKDSTMNSDFEQQPEIEKDKIKLIDFGLSTQLVVIKENEKDKKEMKEEHFLLCEKQKQKQTQKLMHSMCGTIFYVAPEIINLFYLPKGYGYCKKVDIWSAGISLYVMLCGEAPFNADTDPEIYKKILKGIFSIPKHIQLSFNAVSLLFSLLEVNVTKRITIEQIFTHPWITGPICI